MKMALRLRKDVQKASYYVWFLGAEESKGLRGSKVLLPVLPRLLERSRVQEPLKVTLQISHKGLKIIQGSTKHFIPHGAITCSIQTDDIVACVLLLYNPATKCPLHVHAYRCDSEHTATALNEQLQILINRPENQKRFNELEARLGYQHQHQNTAKEPAPAVKSKQQVVTRRYESPRRFDSSLGSDTGTSTRESECSEEHSPTSLVKPFVEPESAKLFDSLAAELRAKLNGNGPPLLLPPRDYDTVHRAQGNLAAIELRRRELNKRANNANNILQEKRDVKAFPFISRCRNQSVVGANLKKPVKHVVSSRGSSGIGSDLAPSPERQDGLTSSEEDWVNDHQESVIIMPATQTRPKKVDDHIMNNNNNKSKQASLERKGVTGYVYPHQPQIEMTRYQRSSSREDNGSPKSSGEEEEVRPVLTHPVPIEKRFKDVFKISDYSDEERMAMERKRVPVVEEFKEATYKKQPQKVSKYTRNVQKVSDKQKHTEQRYRSVSPRRREEYHEGEPEDLDRIYRAPVERTKSLKRYEQMTHDRNFEFDQAPVRHRNRSIEPNRYRDQSPPPHNYRDGRHHDTRDGYRHQQPESMPMPIQYREPQQNNMHMMKSMEPASYKSYEDQRWARPVEQFEHRRPVEQFEHHRDSHRDGHRDIHQNVHRERELHHQDRSVPQNFYRGDMSPRVIVHRADVVRPKQLDTSESTLTKASPRDRFQNAKEKFQAMEQGRQRKPVTEHQNHKMLPPVLRKSMDRGYEPNLYQGNWSSDEDLQMRTNYRELPPTDRYPGLDRETGGRMLPSKSLGNLVKGYRHSYAEPRFAETRQFLRNGRVGLAAVTPY